MTIEADGQQAAPDVADSSVVDTAQVADDTSGSTSDTSEAGSLDDGGDDTANAEPAKPAKGVQKRLDELTKRYREAERREERLLALLERQGQGVQQHQPAPVHQGPPREDQYATYEEYDEARIAYVVEQRFAAKQQEEAMRQRQMSVSEKIEAGRAKYEDFDDAVNGIPMTPYIQQALIEADNTVEASYWLGKNPQEAQRIANLPPMKQALEIGRIAERLLAAEAKPQPPAPKPIPPTPPQTVAGLSAGMNKTPEEMTMAEYKAWRESQS
jgi:hypothetical protein